MISKLNLNMVFSRRHFTIFTLILMSVKENHHSLRKIFNFFRISYTKSIFSRSTNGIHIRPKAFFPSFHKCQLLRVTDIFGQNGLYACTDEQCRYTVLHWQTAMIHIKMYRCFGGMRREAGMVRKRLPSDRKRYNSGKQIAGPVDFNDLASERYSGAPYIIHLVHYIL